MTTPEQFYRNVLESMKHLDTVLPVGSHVNFIGLPDARILFNALSEREHPLGPKYRTIYDYLNCLSINPCYMWMNSNETLRNLATERANILNSMYSKLISEHTFRHFKMSYQDFPLKDLLERAKRENVHPSRLIEEFDGFHPSQLGQNWGAEVIWNKLKQMHPEAIGDENPNNNIIKRVFGNQGGY